MNMSQVRKLLKGQNIPKAQDGYKFHLDSQDIYLTDEDLAEIDEMMHSYPMQERQFLANATNAIKSGQEAGNRSNNTGTEALFSGLSEKNMTRLEKQRGSFMESAIPTDSYWAKIGLNHFLQAVHTVYNKNHNSTDDKSKNSNKTKIDNSTISLDFNDGVLSKTAGENITARNRIKQIIEHINAGDNSTYDASLWTNLDTIKTLLENNPNYTDDLWTRMGTAGYQQNDADKDFLRNFGITFGDSTSDDSGSKKTDTQKQLEVDFKDNPDLYKSIKDKFAKDEFGIWRLKPGETFDLGFNLLPGQGIWFNDDFYKSKYATDPRLNALRGLTYYNGALYSPDSPELARILNLDGGYNQLMSEGRWSEANNIIWSDFTDLARNFPTRLSENQYNGFLSNNPQYLFSNITGAVKDLIDVDGNPYTLGQNEDIIQYIDLDNPMMIGPYKRYKFNYGVVDKTGNTAKLISNFKEIPRVKAKDFSAWYPRIIDSDNEQYNGRYFINVKDSDGNDTEYAFYVNPDNPNDVYFHIPNLKARGINSTDDVKLPPIVAKKLLETKDKWLPNVISSTINQKLFGQFISKLLQPKYRQAGFSWIPWNPDAYLEFFNSDKDTLRDLGLDDNDVNEIITAMHNAYKEGNTRERISKYRRTPPTSINKDGGKIQYISKLASGGVSGATNAVSDKKSFDKVNTKKTNPNNPAPITHIGQSDWSDADTMDLVALIGDLGSLAAAFIPGANTASAAIGAGSSFSRFGADISRDKDWLSATGGLLLNLTMDAATLLPFAGGLAKDIKTITAIKKALPTIIKAASIYGLGSAVVESANKIANNESWTTRDVANLINGLTAITGISRQGLGKGKKTVTTNSMSVPTRKTNKVDLKGKSIELTSDEVSNIAKLDKAKQSDALDNLLWNKVKEQTGNSNLSKEDALAAVDRSQFDKDGRNWNPFKKGFLRQTTNFELGNTTTTTYNKSSKRGKYNNALIYGNQKSTSLPPKVPTRSDVRVSTGKAMDANGYVYNIGDAPTGSTPIYRTYKNRVVRPEDAQLVPFTGNTTSSTNFSFAVPQWFGPQYFINESEQSTLPQHKKGGIIKAQLGVKFDPNWKVPGWQLKETIPTWKQGSLYPSGMKPTIGTTTNVSGVLGMPDFDPTGGVTLADIVTRRKTATGVKESNAVKQKMVAGPTNPIPDRTRWLIPGISALGAISNLIQSKKYADEEKDKINDGRYSLQSQPIDLMAYYNPIFERRRQEVNQRRMSGLLATPTNDWTLYNAGLNQLQSQLDAQLGELTTQEAQDKFTRDQTNVQLRNQKFALDTNTANENARMDAYFDMTSHDPKLAQMMRNWQTKENFRMQMLNTINKDINTIYGYKQNKFNMDQSRDFDSWLRSHYAAEVEAYSKLDYNQRMQYADLEDYIERTNPNAVEAIRVQKQLMQERYLNWLRQNGTTFNYGWLSGRTSPETDAYKKGGTLRGKTRYTMEPDERIWVDNNKAAHAAVAKLNESTIKMLLKALK